MAFNLSFWRAPEKRVVVDREDDLGDTVAKMVDARMTLLRATFAARAATLRGQAFVTDSALRKAELNARADELDFVVAEMGG